MAIHMRSARPFFILSLGRSGRRTDRTSTAPKVVRRLGLLFAILCAVSMGQYIAGQAASDGNSVSTMSEVTPMPEPSLAIPDTIRPDLAAPEVPDSYVIGPNDLLYIFVYQMPELTTQARVNKQGEFRLPLVAAGIPAAGLTSPALAQRIRNVLIRDQLATNPHVRVVVRQVMSRPIVVSGAVQHPIVLQAARPMHLLEVLSRAGGPLPTAGATIYISRATSNGSETKMISLDRLLKQDDPSSDPILTGGETVRIDQPQKIYAVGSLERPGAFPIEAGEHPTVLRLVSLAQGFSKLIPADKSHAKIIRTSSNGKRTEIPVNLTKILSYQQPDLPLEAGDILYVPENGKHQLLTTVLQDAGQAVVIAVGYNATHVF